MASTIEYVTSPQKVAPSAATAATITPNGTAYAWSAWTEVISSASTDLVLTGVTVNGPSSLLWQGLGCYVDIGVGSAGSEVSIGTLILFHAGYQAGTPVAWRMLPVPYGTVSSGSRVAVRLAKATTNTDAWYAALTYYEAPVDGVLTTTSQALTTLPASGAWVDVSVGATPDTYSSWVELSSGVGSQIALALISANTGAGGGGHYTVQIGTGTAGNETVIAQCAFRSGGGLNAFQYATELVRPLITIGSSTRLAVRIKSDFNQARTYVAAVAYYALPL